MVIKVGVNGFGRIGRIIFRTCLQNSDLQLSAINDPAVNAEYICYLIKFDSTHGKFKGNIRHSDDEITIDDHSIKVFHEKLPSSVPWQLVGVQYVIEASGMFTSLEKASGHLASDSVKRVIVTAPSVDVPMVIIGVNENKYSPEHKVISCASSTLYCLAPIIKVLEDNFGLSEGFITSIHAMTPSLKPLDGLCLRGKHWRDHRSIHQNIIPATTGACKALGKIIPKVKDKMSGLAFRVPIVNVSVLDLTVRLTTNTTLQEIIKNVETASNTNMRNIIKISNEEAVSSDFIGDSHSCIFDLDSSLQLKPNFFKLICWYENEYSYACRVIDSIFLSEKQICILELPREMTYMKDKLSKKQNVVQQTECYLKEISIECNYNIDMHPKIICSTSQDTGIKTKQVHRPILLKKPIFSHNSGTPSPMCGRDPKKRNELFKIWNDNSEEPKPFARQKRNSFFHSCIAFPPQNTEQSDRFKAQERLENVKKEFSKMVNITEDLLKKSYSSKFKLNSLAKPTDELEVANVVIIKTEEETQKSDTESYNKFQNNFPIFDVSGDCKSCVDSNNSGMYTCSTKGEKSAGISYEKEDSDCSVYELERTDTKKSMTVEDQTESSLMYPNTLTASSNSLSNISNTIHNSNLSSNTVCSKKTCAISKTNSDFKEQVAKTVNTLIDVLSQNLQDKCPNFTPTLCSNDLGKVCRETTRKQDTKTYKKPFDNNVNVADRTIRGNNAFKIESTSDADCKVNFHEKYKYKEGENKIHIIDEELKKRNIVLVNYGQYVNVETENKIGNNENEYFIEQTVDQGEHTDVPRRILEDLNRCLHGPVVNTLEDTSRCNSPENTNTTLSNGEGNVNKQDIYDKLDSPTTTDSNISFEMNERESEVINITDLTNSLDDLARLDKICRIIEISDELSDKLFSSLDNKSYPTENKRWSFKDLCERIKLEEFCNNIFGKTAM